MCIFEYQFLNYQEFVYRLQLGFNINGPLMNILIMRYYGHTQNIIEFIEFSKTVEEISLKF